MKQIGAAELGERWSAFYRRLQQKSSGSLPFFLLLWVLTKPLESRFTDWLNGLINTHGGTVLGWVRTALEPYGVTGTAFLFAILGLVLHAYVSTREHDEPEQSSIDFMKGQIAYIRTDMVTKEDLEGEQRNRVAATDALASRINQIEQALTEGAESLTPSVTPPLQSPSPIQIRFKDDFFEWTSEPGISPLDLDARRKRYYVMIHNSFSTQTIKSVAVDIESILAIPNRPNEIAPPSPEFVGERLPYHDKTTEKDFPPKRDQKVWLVSHSNAISSSYVIRIEGSERKFPHRDRQYVLNIKVTADGMPPETLSVNAWVDKGELTVAWPSMSLQALYEYRNKAKDNL